MTASTRSGRSTKFPVPSAFWNCSFSVTELLLLSVGLAGSLALHLSPVMNSGMNKPLLVVLGVICMLRPVTGFFFMGASSILPTTSADVYALAAEVEGGGGLAESGTQFAFFSWLIALVLAYRKFGVKELGVMSSLVPFVLWSTAIGGFGSVMSLDLWKSLAFSIMATHLARESDGHYLKCLLGLGFGLLMVTVGFWAKAAGLPVQLLTWGGERSGFDRTGGVVADSVMLWPPILTGVGVLIGVAAFVQSRGQPRPSKWTKMIAFGGFFLSIVPLISAMTNSAILGMAVIIAAYAGSAFRFGRRKRTNVSQSSPVFILIGLAGVVAAVVATDAFDSRRKLDGLLEFYTNQSEEMGAAGSRSDVWEASMDTIMRYPLFGFTFSGGVETKPLQYADKEYFLSHNVFLDAGRYGGIPAILLFGGFFFYPVLLAFKTGRAFHFLPFLLATLAQFLFFTSLSFWTYKPFWAFWALFMMAVSETMERKRAMNQRKLTRKWRSLGFAERPEPRWAEA
jgi:hypothetical protein